MALEEHQSALELIMSKYREQVVKLVVANRLDRSSHAAISDDPQVRPVSFIQCLSVFTHTLSLYIPASLDHRSQLYCLLFICCDSHTIQESEDSVPFPSSFVRNSIFSGCA